MKTALLITVLLLLTACGKGANAEAKFIGLWEFVSGTRDGVSCFKHLPESTFLAGKQTTFMPNESWKGNPDEISVLGSLSPCDGEVWLVAENPATLRRPQICPSQGQEQTFTGTLTLKGQTMAVEWNERTDWFHLVTEKMIYETCTYTYHNAVLRYVGPYIP